MSKNPYETFRTALTMNLCRVLPADQLAAALEAVDVSLSDYDLTPKRVELITASGVPEVVKCYLATKAVANLSTKTLAQYRYKLTHFFDTVRKSYMDITPNDIRMYLYQFKQARGASDRYLEAVRITLHGFFAWLVDNEYMNHNPVAKVEHIHFQEKKREPLTPYQLELFRWNTENVREKALIDFFFSTGCRVSECAAVRLSDIDWNARSVLIRHGKGDKQRTVYFNAESELTLRQYLATRDDETDALFVSMKKPHAPIGAHALENILKKVSERTGLHVFPHRLRHTFATSGLRGGMPLHQLQQLMGHSNAETTMIYAKIDQDDLRLEHRRVYA